MNLVLLDYELTSKAELTEKVDPTVEAWVQAGRAAVATTIAWAWRGTVATHMATMVNMHRRVATIALVQTMEEARAPRQGQRKMLMDVVRGDVAVAMAAKAEMFVSLASQAIRSCQKTEIQESRINAAVSECWMQAALAAMSVVAAWSSQDTEAIHFACLRVQEATVASKAARVRVIVEVEESSTKLEASQAVLASVNAEAAASWAMEAMTVRLEMLSFH